MNYPGLEPSYWNQVLQQIIRQQEAQKKEWEEKLKLLEDEQVNLGKKQQELEEAIRNLKTVHIENINYKIQELTVQELKGTLNIGMTALADPKEIKKWLEQGENDIQMGNMVQPSQEESETEGNMKNG